MSNKLLSLAAVVASLAALGTAGTAEAATYKCKCDAGFATSGMPQLQTNDFKATCASTWTAGKPSNETDTGDYSGLIKATFVEGAPSDGVTAIRVRSRNSGQCVQALYDAHGNKEEWRGAVCDTSQNTSRDGFNITDLAKPVAGVKQMAGMVEMTSKKNNFLAFYSDNAAKGGKGYTLLAACVEPK